jgi:membrane protein implicated in regulation of membrane protease activity
MPTLTSLGIWNWFIVGGILLAIEVMAPGSFMLWLGLSALLVGIISLVIDWPWQAQFVAFAIFAIVSIPIWHRIGRRMGKAGDQPFLNRRQDALVGRVFMLERPIVNGAGTIRVGDTVWRVTGPDQPAGNRVKITGADGGTLMVEGADA